MRFEDRALCGICLAAVRNDPEKFDPQLISRRIHESLSNRRAGRVHRYLPNGACGRAIAWAHADLPVRGATVAEEREAPIERIDVEGEERKHEVSHRTELDASRAR